MREAHGPEAEVMLRVTFEAFSKFGSVDSDERRAWMRARIGALRAERGLPALPEDYVEPLPVSSAAPVDGLMAGVPKGDQ